jgi:hypothetical protein
VRRNGANGFPWFNAIFFFASGGSGSVGVGYWAKEEAAKSFHAEMTSRIRLQFHEPRISRLLVVVASMLPGNTPGENSNKKGRPGAMNPQVAPAIREDRSLVVVASDFRA